MACDGKRLTGLWFDGQKYFGDTLPVGGGKETMLPVFDLTVKWLDAYFNGEIPDFTPPIHLDSTPFRMEVWDILKTIPYGKTITYMDIAKIIAKNRGVERMSAQAVGGAVGHNPISIIVPCHRVVGSSGHLTGYAGGLDKKTALLHLETRQSYTSTSGTDVF